MLSCGANMVAAWQRRSNQRSKWLSANRLVRVSNPDRVYFPARGATKLDLVNYYLSVGDGIVNALRERPCMLHRFPDGLAGEKVHQKRVPTAPRRGSRRSGSSSRGTTGTPTSLCDRARRGDLGRADVDGRVPSVELGRPTPRSPTSGASTSTRCRSARSTGSSRWPAWPRGAG